jgi:hypothetical protein
MPATYQTARLAPGRHLHPDDGVCVMELSSMLAGEPLTDHPRTVSPVLGALLRGYNDGLDSERRQTLKRYAAECLGTARGRAAERERRRRVRRWLAETGGPGGAGGPISGFGLWLRVFDMHHIGRALGFRVREREDAELHRRTLALLDELVVLTGPSPAPPVPEPARETNLV